MDVFLLWHTHALPGGEDDDKLIGVYSTAEMAERAKRRALLLPGFKDMPDGFVIDRYGVDDENWQEGYVTITQDHLMREDLARSVADDGETPMHAGIHGLNLVERWQLANALVSRRDAPSDAKVAFRRAYPAAPDEMIYSAAFHVYVDGPEAVLDWLADAELFLRDPNHRLSSGISWHLLYHVYNWHLFEALLPHARPGVLQLLKELKELLAEGDLEAVRHQAEQLEELFDASASPPSVD